MLFFQIIRCSKTPDTNISNQVKYPNITPIDNTSQIEQILKENGISEQQSKQFIKDNPTISTILKDQFRKLVNESKNGNKIDFKKLLEKIRNQNDDLPQDFINKHGKYIVIGKAFLKKGKHKFLITRIDAGKRTINCNVFINGVDVTEKCKIEEFQDNSHKRFYKVLAIDIEQQQDELINVIICFKQHTPFNVRCFLSYDKYEPIYSELNFKYYNGRDYPFNIAINKYLKKVTDKDIFKDTDILLPTIWGNKYITTKNSDGTITYKAS